MRNIASTSPANARSEKATRLPVEPGEIYELLAAQHEIAVIWSTDDVREVRPDLSEKQAWTVLQSVRENHDASVGVSWETLEITADDLFADQSNEPTKAVRS
jgi:hypothetical protein